jgi:hypothetical protein
MATKKKGASFLQKAKVKLKVALPVGVTLTPGETIVLSEMYQDDVKVLEKNSVELRKAISATESSLSVQNSVKTARAARSQAVGTYKITKDPIKKREWARRIVVADQTIQSIRDVKMRLAATKDRLTMIKGDMELQLMEAEAKAAEMQAYAAAGQSLRLAGEKLMQARTRANKLSLEYGNLEVTMEGAEGMISKLTAKEIEAKAEEVLVRGQDEDDE